MQGEERPPPEGVHDLELARVLVPVLLERIEGTTLRILRIEGQLGEAVDEPGADEPLEEETREADQLGWLLGWIAGGLGSELLLERHEPRALALALALVDDALACEGHALPPIDLPNVSHSGGWLLAWAVAGLAWRAALGRPPVTNLDLALGDGDGEAHLTGVGAASQGVCARGRALERGLEGTRFEERPGGWRWCFPADWLETDA